MRNLVDVTARLSESKAVVPGKRVRIDFGDEGCIYLDGVNDCVSNAADEPTDAVIKISFLHFLAMADGSLNGTMAFMQGKIKIEGDMSVAMQLQSVTSQIAG